MVETALDVLLGVGVGNLALAGGLFIGRIGQLKLRGER